MEKATIIHYHRHRIDVYSNGTVKALGWKGKESQIKRFETLSGVGDLNGCSILDVGCGYGDLKGYLDGRSSDFTYVGMDQMPEFIAEAKERYKDCVNTFFYQTDFTAVAFPQVDYVMASGALSYRCDNPNFYTHMIRKMYKAAVGAVAFNMLDADRFPECPLLVGHDCDKIVAFCNSLSPCVKVVRGYLEDDFTVFIYKEQRPLGKQLFKSKEKKQWRRHRRQNRLRGKHAPQPIALPSKGLGQRLSITVPWRSLNDNSLKLFKRGRKSMNSGV